MNRNLFATPGGEIQLNEDAPQAKVWRSRQQSRKELAVAAGLIGEGDTIAPILPSYTTAFIVAKDIEIKVSGPEALEFIHEQQVVSEDMFLSLRIPNRSHLRFDSNDDGEVTITGFGRHIIGCTQTLLPWKDYPAKEAEKKKKWWSIL